MSYDTEVTDKYVAETPVPYDYNVVLNFNDIKGLDSPFQGSTNRRIRPYNFYNFQKVSTRILVVAHLCLVCHA
jgi:hypothetical protein